MAKESFIIYKSFYEPIKFLNDEQLGKLFRMIFEFQINGVVDCDDDIKMAFEFFRNQFSVDEKKYAKVLEKRSEAGKRGMEKRWKKDEKSDNTCYENNNKCYKNITNDIKNITNITDNDNVNENDNVNVNVNDNDNDNVNIYNKSGLSPDTIVTKKSYISEIKEIVDYMNEIGDRSYKYNTDKTKKVITARLNEGFTVDDFKDVIYNQAKKWLTPRKKGQKDMSEYFRPETLFGNKFEGYLQDYKQYEDREE